MEKTLNKSFVFQYGVLSVCIFATFQFVYAEGGADGHGALAPNNSEPTPEATMTDRFGIGFVPVPELIMPAIDVIGYLKEDELGDKSGAFRFAIERSIDLTIDDGQWIDVVDGRLWRVDIRMDGALSSRLHISGLNLAEGHELALVSPDSEQPLTGILTGTGEFGTGEAYGICTPSILSRIEWFVPTGSVAKQLPFESVANGYGYRDVFDVFAQLGGTCSLNPGCYSAWLNESNATCKLTFTSGGAGYICSSQLIAAIAADETPYAATANHCVSTTAEANSCAFIFFYRSACTGGNSAGTTVSGADLTATSSSSDCTLLLVRGALPLGVYWSGWTNTNPTTNTASTGLHHPSGTAQAISFGVKNAGSFNCASPQTNWNSLSWNNGITEGGSSGSAIYRDSDHKMYGVLTCGASACSNPGGDDGYGRWGVAANTTAFSGPLAAGSDDAQEQNDTCASPKVLGAGTYNSLVVKRLDEDWYSLNVPVGATLSGTFTYTHANGDIDLELFNACGTTPVVVRNGNVNNETLSYVNPGPATTLLLRVFLASDTRNNYSMVLTIPVTAPANDNCTAATAVGAGAFAFNTTNATTVTPTLPASCDEGSGIAFNKDVWFKYTSACAGTATASTCNNASFDTRIAVYSGTSCPISTTPVSACSDNAASCASSTSKASWAVTAGSTWYVRVGSPGSTSGTGTLTMSCAVTCIADRNGDNFIDGADLGIILGAWATAGGDINGDGYTDGADLSILLGAWGACP